MSKISIIVAREFNERVRKRSFLITTILTPLLMVGLVGAMIAMMTLRSGDIKRIEVIDASGVVAQELENSGVIEFVPSERSLEEINSYHPDTWGVLTIGADVVDNPSNVQLYTYSSSTLETETSVARAIESVVEAEKLKRYDIENLPRILDEVRTRVQLTAFKVDDSGSKKESSSVLAMGLAYALGFLMYMFVLLYGAQVMNGVIEEKNSKVLEVMVSSVRPFQLMMGKIVGIALVAVTQFVIWVAILAIAGAAMVNTLVPADLLTAAQAGTPAANFSYAELSGFDPDMVAALSNAMDFSYIGKMLAVFLVFFVGGYLLYAGMFAAVGSAVDNVQDSQQFQMPITLPLVLGLIGMINAMQDPTSGMAFWLSIIPFTSPMVMVARVPYGVPAWELILSVALLIVSFIVMVWLAGKIYRVGIFMYGKKPTFRELAKWITYKS